MKDITVTKSGKDLVYTVEELHIAGDGAGGYRIYIIARYQSDHGDIVRIKRAIHSADLTTGAANSIGAMVNNIANKLENILEG